MQVRVYYEDTDCGGVVYYANYLRYFERARTEFFREHGMEVADFAAAGTVFLVAHVDIRFLSPARYNDLLRIETRIAGAGGASFTFHHRVLLEGPGRVVAEGRVKMVCVDSGQKPKRLPSEVARLCEKLIHDSP